MTSTTKTTFSLLEQLTRIQHELTSTCPPSGRFKEQGKQPTKIFSDGFPSDDDLAPPPTLEQEWRSCLETVVRGLLLVGVAPRNGGEDDNGRQEGNEKEIQEKALGILQEFLRLGLCASTSAVEEDREDDDDDDDLAGWIPRPEIKLPRALLRNRPRRPPSTKISSSSSAVSLMELVRESCQGVVRTLVLRRGGRRRGSDDQLCRTLLLNFLPSTVPLADYPENSEKKKKKKKKREKTESAATTTVDSIWTFLESLVGESRRSSHSVAIVQAMEIILDTHAATFTSRRREGLLRLLRGVVIPSVEEDDLPTMVYSYLVRVQTKEERMLAIRTIRGEVSFLEMKEDDDENDQQDEGDEDPDSNTRARIRTTLAVLDALFAEERHVHHQNASTRIQKSKRAPASVAKQAPTNSNLLLQSYLQVLDEEEVILSPNEGLPKTLSGSNRQQRLFVTDLCVLVTAALNSNFDKSSQTRNHMLDLMLARCFRSSNNNRMAWNTLMETLAFAKAAQQHQKEHLEKQEKEDYISHPPDAATPCSYLERFYSAIAPAVVKTTLSRLLFFSEPSCEDTNLVTQQVGHLLAQFLSFQNGDNGSQRDSYHRQIFQHLLQWSSNENKTAESGRPLLEDANTTTSRKKPPPSSLPAALSTTIANGSTCVRARALRNMLCCTGVVGTQNNNRTSSNLNQKVVGMAACQVMWHLVRPEQLGQQRSNVASLCIPPLLAQLFARHSICWVETTCRILVALAVPHKLREDEEVKEGSSQTSPEFAQLLRTVPLLLFPSPPSLLIPERNNAVVPNEDAPNNSHSVVAGFILSSELLPLSPQIERQMMMDWCVRAIGAAAGGHDFFLVRYYGLRFLQMAVFFHKRQVFTQVQTLLARTSLIQLESSLVQGGDASYYKQHYFFTLDSSFAKEEEEEEEEKDQPPPRMVFCAASYLQKQQQQFSVMVHAVEPFGHLVKGLISLVDLYLKLGRESNSRWSPEAWLQAKVLVPKPPSVVLTILSDKELEVLGLRARHRLMLRRPSSSSLGNQDKQNEPDPTVEEFFVLYLQSIIVAAAISSRALKHAMEHWRITPDASNAANDENAKETPPKMSKDVNDSNDATSTQEEQQKKQKKERTDVLLQCAIRLLDLQQKADLCLRQLGRDHKKTTKRQHSNPSSPSTPKKRRRKRNVELVGWQRQSKRKRESETTETPSSPEKEGAMEKEQDEETNHVVETVQHSNYVGNCSKKKASSEQDYRKVLDPFFHEMMDLPLLWKLLRNAYDNGNILDWASRVNGETTPPRAFWHSSFTKNLQTQLTIVMHLTKVVAGDSRRHLEERNVSLEKTNAADPKALFDTEGIRALFDATLGLTKVPMLLRRQNFHLSTPTNSRISPSHSEPPVILRLISDLVTAQHNLLYTLLMRAQEIDSQSILCVSSAMLRDSAPGEIANFWILRVVQACSSNQHYDGNEEQQQRGGSVATLFHKLLSSLECCDDALVVCQVSDVLSVLAASDTSLSARYCDFLWRTLRTIYPANPDTSSSLSSSSRPQKQQQRLTSEQLISISDSFLRAAPHLVSMQRRGQGTSFRHDMRSVRVAIIKNSSRPYQNCVVFRHNLLSYWGALVRCGQTEAKADIVIQLFEALKLTVDATCCSSSSTRNREAPPKTNDLRKQIPFPGLTVISYPVLFEILLYMILSLTSLSMPADKTMPRKRPQNESSSDESLGPYNGIIAFVGCFQDVLEWYKEKSRLVPVRMLRVVIRGCIMMLRICENKVVDVLDWRSQKPPPPLVAASMDEEEEEEEEDAASVSFLRVFLHHLARKCGGCIMKFCQDLRREGLRKRKTEEELQEGGDGPEEEEEDEESYRDTGIAGEDWAFSENQKTLTALMLQSEQFVSYLKEICEAHNLTPPLSQLPMSSPIQKHSKGESSNSSLVASHASSSPQDGCNDRRPRKKRVSLMVANDTKCEDIEHSMQETSPSPGEGKGAGGEMDTEGIGGASFSNERDCDEDEDSFGVIGHWAKCCDRERNADSENDSDEDCSATLDLVD